MRMSDGVEGGISAWSQAEPIQGRVQGGEKVSAEGDGWGCERL